MLQFFSKKRGSEARGFTLIELLVVIAIIGVLASIVLASLNRARSRARDARRITDLKQIQLGLELFFDGVGGGQYPVGTAVCDVAAATRNGLEVLVTNGFMPSVSFDPNGTACYNYASGILTGGTARTSYHLTATMEDAGSVALSNDKDCDSSDNTPRCMGTADGPGAGGATFTGATIDGTGDATNRRFDLVP